MNGPFEINDVSLHVEQSSIGVYILSRDAQTAHYVGRSDSDLRSRIPQSTGEGYGYKYFWFECASSAMRAYHMECRLYHRHIRTIDNKNHPAVPVGTNWRCPVQGCEWA